MTASSILFRGLLSLVLLAPLPLGSNRPWAWSVLAAGVGVLLIVWSALALRGRVRAPIPMSRLWWIAVPFLLVIGCALFQITPFSPVVWHHPLWAEAATVLGLADVGGMISADPALTVNAVLRLATYGGIFWLAVQLGQERSRAHAAVIAVAFAGIAYAAYGLVVFLAGWETILWLPKWSYHGDLTATFVNRNAYGAYAGLGVLACVALFVNTLRPNRIGGERRAHDVAEAVLLRALPFLMGALVIGTALLLSRSRGAFLATGVGLGCLLAAMAWAGMLRARLGIALTACVLAIGVGALLVSGDATVLRLSEQTSAAHEASRLSVYVLVLDAIWDAPLTGTGLGAFLPAFRIYRDATLADPVAWDFAHNVHLEIAMDLGLPAAALFYLCLSGIVLVALAGLRRRRRDHVYPALALASAALIGSHGLVDFSAQMPGVAATLSLLLGIGYAQSWSTARTTDGGGQAPPSG